MNEFSTVELNACSYLFPSKITNIFSYFTFYVNVVMLFLLSESLFSSSSMVIRLDSFISFFHCSVVFCHIHHNLFLQYAIDSRLLSLFLSSLMSDLPNSCLIIFLDCFLSQPPAWCKNVSGSILSVISTVILLWLIFKVLHYMVISIPPFFQICSLYLGKVSYFHAPKQACKYLMEN